MMAESRFRGWQQTGNLTLEYNYPTSETVDIFIPIPSPDPDDARSVQCVYWQGQETVWSIMTVSCGRRVACGDCRVGFRDPLVIVSGSVRIVSCHFEQSR